MFILNQNPISNNNLAIGWVNLSFEARPNPLASSNRILNNINGHLNFGTMTALMGPSGCGKSTLLKCINGRSVEGISSNTKIYVAKKRQLTSCFIVQDVEEHLMYGLTGSESLVYASRIKNNGKKGVDHKENAKKLMGDLMITETAKNLVENCSGGEQKRLVIAMELTSVKKPSILCVDEPTSGLDSNAAEIVMTCLKQVAVAHNIAVVTSIHQPNADVLLLFDKVYVLVKGGKTIFFGPPNDLRNKLLLVGINCQEWQVPIELMIHLATEGLNNTNVQKLIQVTAESNNYINEICKREGVLSPGIEIKIPSFNWIDLWYLIRRSFTCIFRSGWKGMLFYYLLVSAFAFVLSKLYNEDVGKVVGCFDPMESQMNGTCKKGLDRVIEAKIIAQNISLLFFSPVVLMFILLFGTSMSFSGELKLFKNELLNGWYSPSAYYWSKTIVDFPLTIAIGISFGLIVFYGSKQFEDDFRVGMTIYFYIMSVFTAQSLGYFLGITVGQIHPQLPLVSIIGVYEAYLALCDYLVPLDQLPSFINDYVSEVSFPKHLFFGLLVLAYGFDRCPKGQISQALVKFEIEDDDFWRFVIAMVIHLIMYRGLALFSLIWLSKPQIRDMKKRSNNLVKVEPTESLEDFDCYLDIEKNIKNNKKIINQTRNDNINPNNNFKENKNLDLALAWINLTFIGTTISCFGRKPRTILRQLNGRINFGSLTALMGPSGSGKSTLLKCINGQNNQGLSSETQLIISQNKQINSCFIVQDQKEHLLPGLTGRETLLYSSKLKNNGVHYSDDNEFENNLNHDKNIRKLLSDLMITSTSSTMVQKCSGGEQKRLTIAVEMTGVVKPNVICIDEPTSGLDSNAAELVIKNLKTIARQNEMAVVTSIHQPNSDVLLMFDQVYVLAKGGKCIYAGPPQDIRKHLTSCGIECPDWQIPIEKLLKVASHKNTKELKLLAAKTERDNLKLIQQSMEEGVKSNEGINTKNKPFSLLDFWYLICRGVIYNSRCNWIVFLGQFLINLVLNVMLTFFYDKNMTSVDGCINPLASLNESCSMAQQRYEEDMLGQNLSFLFFTSSLLNFIQIAVTIFTFPSEVKIFLNEYRNGWYSVGCYYLSKTIVELPMPILINSSCATMLYLLSHQTREASRFLGVCGMFLLEVLTTQGMSFLFGVMFYKSQFLATITVVSGFICSLFFCGFIAPIDEMHSLVQHFSQLSYLKQFFQAAIVWTYGMDRCEKPMMSSILFRFKLDDDLVWKNAIYLALHFANFRILAFIVLYVKAKYNV